MLRKKIKCDGCGNVYNSRSLKKKKDKLYCHKCSLKKSKCIMPMLIGKIPKSYLPPKLKQKKKLKKRNFISSIKSYLPPKMKGEKKKKTVSKKLHLYITKEERLVLYKKLIVKMSSQEASERIKKISEYSKILAKRIKEESEEKKIKDEQMNKMFLEGLAKYIEEEK